MKRRWETPEQLRMLLNELVGWKSVTLTEGEIQFVDKLYNKMETLSYFQDFPDRLQMHQADKERRFLTALYKHPSATKTICLLSHFDTVPTEEYGEMEPLSTKPEELTTYWNQNQGGFSIDVLKDIQSGEYLFGRGTMDMKMGLVLHLHLLEKAIAEQWAVNVLLLTVPDEEVNSVGMRAAVPILLQWKKKYALEYQLFLNSEPVFSMNPAKEDYYVYTGSIGKILAAALFFGEETHVGEPLRGMTSSYIASFLTREMEWNEVFQESSFEEKTPPPMTLLQKDLKEHYSTQTPYRSIALYNIFTMKRNASETFSLFEQIAEKAAKQCNREYKTICNKYGTKPKGEVKVIRYNDLYHYGIKKHGLTKITHLKKKIFSYEEWDEREKSLRFADRLMIECQELAPAIVILFTPPYYPAVNSTTHPFIEECITRIKKVAKAKFQLPVKQGHYFNGISDLSYVCYEGKEEGWIAYEENTPIWKDGYSIPFEEMQQLQAPILNVGPFGKDAHKRTERLHIRNAFIETPVLLEEVIHHVQEWLGITKSIRKNPEIRMP